MTAISFACVSPHPPISPATWDRASRVAGEMGAHAPQTVVLIATHGPLRADAFGVLAAPVTKGDFAQWRAPQVRHGFDTDLDAVVAIHEEASRSHLRLDSISRWGGGGGGRTASTGRVPFPRSPISPWLRPGKRPLGLPLDIFPATPGPLRPGPGRATGPRPPG